ncbi:AAA family ATPase [Methylomicrobium lacus]|uniref:AAA family ATPase n=1 Tax=Methylomicrobium lacus TaxID=136992 RepID=UPI0035A825A2
MPQPVWLFDRFRLDTGDASLCRDGQVVNLAPKAFALLCCLAERAGRLVTKDELQDAVWTHHFVSESALKGRMNELRQALGDDPKAPRYIETVARRGYRFIAEVSREDAHPVTAAAGPTADAALASIRWDTPDALPGVGREAPLAHLQQLWEKAVTGRRQLAFVTGEAGIGKSTLIEMFMQNGQDKPAVLWGQCIEHFGAGEALLPLLGALARRGPSLISVLRARAPAWLVQMPGLLSAEQRLDLQREVLGATQERMLREGCEILETLSADTPLIVVLEDLHWSDYATLDLLAALGRRPEPAALLVIGSYRPSDVALRDHPMRRVQQELQAHKLCAEVALDSFSREELRTYLGRRFPEGCFPEAIAEILHRRTGGHPLFLVNLLDYLLAEERLKQSGGWWSVAGGGDGLERGVPDDIRQMIEQQCARLSPDEQKLLGVASAAGMDSSAALLAAVLQEDPLTIEARCEALAQRGPMLAAAGVSEWPDGTLAGNYAFRHALYAEVLYQRLPPAYRISVHRRLGERLELAYAERTAEIAAELARHFEEGRDFVKAVRYLQLAAGQAAGRFANREALDYLGRALALVERLPVETQMDSRLALLQQRALIHRTLNDWPGMVADLEALVALARAERRGEEEVGSLISLSWALFHSDRSRHLAIVEQAVERSGGLANHPLKAYAVANRAYFRLDFGMWGNEDMAAIAHGVEIARQARDDRPLALYRMIQSILDLNQADYAGALAAAQEVARFGLAMGDGYLHLGGQYLSTWALLGLGRWGELRRVLAESIKAAEQNNSPMGRSIFHLAGAALHLEVEDFQGALALCERGQLPPSDPALFLHRVLRGQAHLGLGEYAEAARWFGEFTRGLDAGGLTELRNQTRFRSGLGAYWLAQREPARARAEAGRLLELSDPPGNCAYQALGHRLLAQAALAEQDWDVAATQLSRALAIVENAEVPLAAWRVYETAAELYARQGQTGPARDFRHKAEAGLSRLAGSLDENDPLRRSLLAHPLLQGEAAHKMG